MAEDLSNLTEGSPASEKISILIVDDRPEKRLALETTLTGLNQNIVTAGSGKEALRHLLREDFAVILLDVNMPDMDGFETAALIRQRPRSETTPIIFVSAINDTETHVSRGYSLGGVDYILTPIIPEILRAKVAVFVELFKKTEQVKQQAEQSAEIIRAQAAREAAERANAAKDSFLAMLSHELRTPLTPVLAAVLALADEPLSEEVRDSLEMIRRNVELEARLIDDLLDLTRISNEKLPIAPEVVDAHQLLGNVIEICRVEIEDKKIHLNTDLSATRVNLVADPARFQQIFWNLIKNAVKFTPEGGSITIRTHDADDRLQIEIADTGMGMAASLVPRIFEPFEQGEQMHRGGLGLGLSIARALVELQRGNIVAESDGLGKGSKFILTFQTTSQSPAQHASTTVLPIVSPAGQPRATPHILLVEDHEDTNRSLTNLLEKRGYPVRSAVSVKTALEWAERESFDVLICDMGLPDGTGLDVVQKGFPNAILGIALSGYGMEADVSKSLEAGFQHHLVKPVDLNKLDEIIQHGVMAI